ncbi:MAG: hypothetical protein RMK60_01665 [Burkholderiales bacterium]|nr:hypothetical protein [Burkholderiales bacterium]
MIPRTYNLMIHVDDDLPGDEMATLADGLLGHRCVLDACVSASAPHLIMVRYNADCAPARAILNEVRQRGVQAELVGF